MFVVVYRWRLRAGAEERFVEAWRRMTESIRDARGGLGSRLHRGEDGVWVAYAQWPDEATLLAARAKESANPEAGQAMRACVAESFPEERLTVEADLLVGPLGT